MAVRKDARGRWTVEFQASGKRVFRRLPAIATKEDAKQLESRLRREIFERGVLGRADEPSLAAAIQLWVERTAAGRKDPRSPEQNAAHLRDYVGTRMLREVGDAAAAAIQAWNEELAPGTINRRLDVLRAAARHAWKQGWIGENLAGRVPKLREDNARQVYLTAAEVRKLASKAPDKLSRSIIMLAAYTGLRASELWAQPKPPKGATALMVPKSKTGPARQVPISDVLRAHLSVLPLPIPYRAFMDSFWTARKAAGMEHVHFHDLRHSFASMLINQGVDLYTVGKLLGHASPATTQRYAHLADAPLREAVNKLR